MVKLDTSPSFSKANMKPTCRKGSQQTERSSKNGDLYLFGGLGNDNEYDNTLWKYDMNKQSWSPVVVPKGSPIPAGRWKGILQFISDDQILLFGGSNTENYFADIWIFNVESSIWKKIESPSKIQPKPRRAFSGTFVGSENSLIVVGGKLDGGEVLNETWILKLSDFTWKKGGDVPGLPRKGLSCIAIENEVLIFGGRSDNVQYMDDLMKYDFVSGSWKERIQPPPSSSGKNTIVKPTKRNHHVALAVPNEKKMLIYGGRSSHDPPNNKPLSDVWVFDLTANAWEQTFPKGDLTLPMMLSKPEPRIEASASSGMSQNRKMVMNNGQNVENKLLNDVWEINYNPTLNEFAWKRVESSDCNMQGFIHNGEAIVGDSGEMHLFIIHSSLAFVFFASALLFLFLYRTFKARQMYKPI